jgi:hypothetical protein
MARRSISNICRSLHLPDGLFCARNGCCVSFHPWRNVGLHGSRFTWKFVLVNVTLIPFLFTVLPYVRFHVYCKNKLSVFYYRVPIIRLWLSDISFYPMYCAGRGKAYRMSHSEGMNLFQTASNNKRRRPLQTCCCTGASVTFPQRKGRGLEGNKYPLLMS